MMNRLKSLNTLRGPDSRILREGIRILSSKPAKPHPLALPEQPFDSELLRASPLFRRSRELYVKQGGKFLATLVSSPRTLTSPILLEQRIEYTPLARELNWMASDRAERTDALVKIRAYCTNLFHEQNHRILWKLLPPPPRSPKLASRYLNFVESLIVALDMTLGDSLGHGISRFFYLAGVNYDPGTDIRQDVRSSRDYRNYLHVCAYATFMKLEFYEESDIRNAVDRLYPQNPRIVSRALDRALRLDDDFVQITNPAWKKKHLPLVIQTMGKPDSRALILPENPLENHLHYLWAERWLDFFKVR